VLIRNCEFINLHCPNTNDGGAWYIAIPDTKTYSFTDCTFTGCGGDYSGSGGNGGGIFIDIHEGNADHSGILVLVRTTFTSCTGRQGGAVYSKGFIIIIVIIIILLLLLFIYIFYKKYIT
jgi:hypothetical protein